MTMGTASTMACLMEALGIALPTNGAIPAVDARRFALAHMAGRRIVEMVEEGLGIDKILTRQAFENAIVVTGALGGSTNAVVHLLAIAGRLGVSLTLDDWDRLGRDVPCLVNLMPSGKHLMEDFYYAGGIPVVVKELGDRIHGDALTVTGRSIGQNCARAECFDRDVIFPVETPFQPNGGIAVLRGNLAPNGAIIKPSAATPSLMRHTGRAIVFDDIDDYRRRIDNLDLDVTPNNVLMLKNCGPCGYPGFPEVGNMAIPLRLLRDGVTDMVRISDARMSGTAYGTVVLHVAPEAAVGGPLALIETGDTIELDVEARLIMARLTCEEFLQRKQAWVPPLPPIRRGWYRLFHEHVLQADRGVDLDFLVGASGAPVPRESE
jgi:L-arabonate dehydrase